MKPRKSILALAVLLMTAAATGSTFADDDWHHGHWRGHSHPAPRYEAPRSSSSFGLGIYLGPPAYYYEPAPTYYYYEQPAPYYYQEPAPYYYYEAPYGSSDAPQGD